MRWVQWQPIGADAYMQIAYMAQAYENMQYIRRQMLAYLKHAPPLLEIDTGRGYAQQPLPGYINLVERNLERLAGEAAPWFEGEATRTWLGEQMDEPRLSYRDVNRWFGNLQKLKDLLDFAAVPARVSGAFCSGRDIRLQVIRKS